MRSDIRKIAYISRRALALLLTLVMVLAIVPPIDIFAATQDPSSMQIVFDATPPKAATQSEAAKPAGPYYHKPIVINATTMANFETYNNRYRILIRGEPFSVTVQGLTNVDITFDNVTVNRAADTINRPGGDAEEWIAIEAGSGAAFLQASQDLGWSDGNNTHFVPTCPFWIRDGAEVVASFIGNNVFKASGNLWRIEKEQNGSIADQIRRTKYDHYHGYAGIQIAPDSSLTIASGTVEAWGSYQMSNITTVAGAIKRYPQSFNKTTTETQQMHPDVSTNSWAGNNAAGGAGIGGGADYNYNTNLENGSPDNYKHFTPGSLTINTGNVTAIGGFKAAGIGGAVNGALTSGTITINGNPATSVANKTTVTAIGSFFAAGIGEGDSVPNHESPAFTKPYALVINGGAVNAYGGYKAAGIGTTDEITDNSNGPFSGLTITLNGGDITALSGEASDPNNATAAIGAGDSTDMADYSISIAEGTVVKAVSYSKYAISNIGSNASTAPQNIIDPNTYMYLAYYDRNGDVSSDDENGREFDLYQIKRTDRGDFMLVVDHTEDVLGQTTHDFVYLGYNEENDRLYVVDQNGKTISDSKKQVEIFYIEYDPTQTSPYSAKGTGANGQEVNLNEIVGQEDLTDLISKLKQDDNVSYYFTAPPMKTFTIPAGYTAVAMTLYHPDDFGGRYIFHVPLDEKNGEKRDVYAIIEKMASGDSSGKVEAVFDSHFTMANPLKPGSPAITPDKISTTLTNLVVTSDTSLNLALNDAEQTFAPGTKSYTIWLPANTTQFNVTPMWATNGSEIVTTIRDGTGTNDPIANGGTKTYKINANETKVIWIEKKDPGASAVVYRLSVRVKPNYEIIMNDPDKVYDGLAASVSYSKMNSIAPTETKYTVTSKTIGALGNNWTPAGSVTPTTITFGGTVDVTYANRRTTSVDYSCTATYSKADNKLTVTTTITGVNNGTNLSAIPHTTTFTYNNGTWSKNDSNTANTSVTLNRTSYTFTVSWNNNTNLQVKVGNQTASPLFNYSTQQTETTSDNSAIVAVQAAQAARDKLKDKTVPNTAEATLNYTATQTVSSTLQLGTASVSVSQISTQLVPITVAVTSSTITNDTSGAVDVTNQLANQKISYSYTQTHDAYGNELAPAVKLDAAPSAAGRYTVTATVNATSFQASGSTSFTISQRPITLIGVENWRYYLNNESPDIIELTTDPNDNTRFYAGAIRMDGVIQDAYGEYDVVEPTYTAMFFKDKEVGALESDKIHIYATLEDSNDNDNANYTFVNYDKAAHKNKDYVGGEYQDSGTYIGSYFFAVPGQITYEVDGAMFLYGDLTSGDDMTDFLWYKYYPVLNNPNDPEQLGKYLVFKDEDGKPGWDDPVDYHSPDNQSHAEHIYVRTVNEGKDEARYAVDITFGDMVFYYTKTIWNVNDLVYEKVNQSEETENPENPENGEEEEEEDTTPLVSQWVAPTVSGTVHGIDLTSGDILIENRSNEPIFFTARTEIDIHCVMVSYNSGMQFEDDTLNEQHRIAARMIWGDKNTWTVEELQEKNNSVNTGNTGVATTQKIEIPAAKNVGINATEAELDTAPGYKIVSIRLFGIPTGTETVGSVTISLVPTN